MSDESYSATLEIQNRKGLHARAAAAFVKAIEDLNAEVSVERIGQTVSGCSIMGLMMLAAAKGTTKTNAERRLLPEPSCQHRLDL